MITAHQAEIIAAMSEHGEIIHREHLEDDDTLMAETREQFRQERESTYGLSDFRFWELLEEASGYRPLSRYDIHEEEGYELENLVEYLSSESIEDLIERYSDLADAIEDYIEDHGGPISDDDRDTFVTEWLYDHAEGEVFCDQCGKRIE